MPRSGTTFQSKQFCPAFPLVFDICLSCQTCQISFFSFSPGCLPDNSSMGFGEVSVAVRRCPLLGGFLWVKLCSRSSPSMKLCGLAGLYIYVDRPFGSVLGRLYFQQQEYLDNTTRPPASERVMEVQRHGWSDARSTKQMKAHTESIRCTRIRDRCEDDVTRGKLRVAVWSLTHASRVVNEKLLKVNLLIILHERALPLQSKWPRNSLWI